MAFDEGLEREDPTELELVAGTLPRVAWLTSSYEVLETMTPTPSQWNHVIEGQVVSGAAISAGTVEGCALSNSSAVHPRTLSCFCRAR